MDKKISILLLTILIINLFNAIIIIDPVSHAQTNQARTATIYLPAVEEKGNTETGVIIVANVTVKPGGTGKVVVKAAGHVDPTTKYSIDQAAAIASILAGVDWRSYDFELNFINATDVAGPSGSAYTSLAFYALITGSPITGFFKNMTMTGAITPVGLFGPIGGALYKCEAAAKSNLTFYYPLANMNTQLLTLCKRGRPVSGLLGTSSSILGIKYTAAPVNITMPREFQDGMREAAEKMREEALRVISLVPKENLSGDAIELYNATLENVNLSIRYEASHPYAAASYAFTALVKAYDLYYLYNTLRYKNNNSVGLVKFIADQAKPIEAQLQNLLNNMSALPSNGSIYYVEFLGTAYSRTASALSNLQGIDAVARYDWYEAILVLGYSKARISSIETWLDVAGKVKDLRPFLTDSDVESLAVLLGDYTHIASQYSISLAQYMIANYKDIVNTNILENYIQTLNDLMLKGDNYISQGNYIAALGFYREALSQSMSNLFSILPVQNKTIQNRILSGYYNESTLIYDDLAIQLTARGLTPGLAPSYMDYAHILYSNGDKTDAINIAMEALASSIEWYLYNIQLFMPRAPGQVPSENQATGFIAIRNYPSILLIAIGILLGLIVGLLYAERNLRSLVRALE